MRHPKRHFLRERIVFQQLIIYVGFPFFLFFDTMPSDIYYFVYIRAKKTSEALTRFGSNLKSGAALAADRTASAFQSLKPKPKDGTQAATVGEETPSKETPTTSNTFSSRWSAASSSLSAGIKRVSGKIKNGVTTSKDADAPEADAPAAPAAHTTEGETAKE